MKRSAFVHILFSLSILTALAATGISAESYKGPKDKLHVYLLIGQSNMAGRAPVAEEDAGVIDRCYLLNGEDQWEPAKNPLNIYSTIRKGEGMQKMNPGYGFSKKMLADDKGISVGLVVNAKGGTKIEQWKKGTKFYKEAVRRAKEAQKTGTLKGILWHQGESNNGAPEAYLKQLEELVADLRKDLGDEDLPFVAGQINEKAGPKINEEIAKLPKAVKNSSFASAKGLTTMDRWHFDAKSMKLLGERYADEMIKLQGKKR